MKKLLSYFIIILFLVVPCFAGDAWVNGYYKKDGTYVDGHYRSAPDGNTQNNWSTQGNYNPHTGKEGTKKPKDSYNTPNIDSGSSNSIFDNQRSGSDLGYGSSGLDFGGSKKKKSNYP